MLISFAIMQYIININSISIRGVTMYKIIGRGRANKIICYKSGHEAEGVDERLNTYAHEDNQDKALVEVLQNVMVEKK